MLIRITAPHFCAGLEMGARCNRVAPILHYMRWWKLSAITDYCARKRWTLEVLNV